MDTNRNIPPHLQPAAKWLETQLADGPRRITDVLAACKSLGDVSIGPVSQVTEYMGVKRVNGNHWALPDSAPATFAAATAPEGGRPAAPPAPLTQEARIHAILTHAEASGRHVLAEHLAFKTPMAVGDAVAAMASAAKDANPYPVDLTAAVKRNAARLQDEAAGANAKAEFEYGRRIALASAGTKRAAPPVVPAMARPHGLSDDEAAAVARMGRFARTVKPMNTRRDRN